MMASLHSYKWWQGIAVCFAPSLTRDFFAVRIQAGFSIGGFAVFLAKPRQTRSRPNARSAVDAPKKIENDRCVDPTATPVKNSCYSDRTDLFQVWLDATKPQ